MFTLKNLLRVGGISTILKELGKREGALDLTAKTVTLKTLGENIADAASPDGDVVKTVEKPFSPTGALAILFGNLAPEGAVIKRSASDIDYFTGPAIVFESMEDACEAILAARSPKDR